MSKGCKQTPLASPSHDNIGQRVRPSNNIHRDGGSYAEEESGRKTYECKNKDTRQQVIETFSPHKRPNYKFTPYSTQRAPQRKTVKSTCPTFTKLKAQLIKDVDIMRYLHFPLETRRLLGKDTSAWCEFHKTYGHDIESCFPLTRQLASLARKGILRKYVNSEDQEEQEDKDCQPGHKKPIGEPNETSILSNFNTIVRGFARGGWSARKRYARNVMSMATMEVSTPILTLTFSGEDMKDVYPPFLISLVMMGRNMQLIRGARQT